MAKDNEKVPLITFRPTKELSDRLDRLAEAAQMKKARLVMNIVDECSKTLEFTKKVGVLQLSVLLRNLGEKMNEWAKDMRSKEVKLEKIDKE